MKLKRSWETDLLTALQATDSLISYTSLFREFLEGKPTCGFHLAVLAEPYLSFILDEKKTVESRFSVNRHAPFEQVGKGDIIILKRSSGPVVGVCKVAEAWFHHLGPDTWPEIERYAAELCMDDSLFWKEKRAASYASLMRIDGVVRVPHIAINKLDRMSWVVLHSSVSGGQQSLF